MLVLVIDLEIALVSVRNRALSRVLVIVFARVCALVIVS